MIWQKFNLWFPDDGCTANIAICPETLSQLLANVYFGTTDAYMVFKSLLLSKKFVLKQSFAKVHS